MSYDRQLEQLCTHLVVEELLTFNSDYQTVVPLRPIASVSSVRVRINGEIEVPFDGVKVSAKGWGTKQGPFSITSANSTFAISVGGGPTQTANVPLGSKVPSQTIVDSLNTQLTGVTFSTEKNYLRFSSNAEGDGATVYVLASSTLAATLGLSSNREFRGKKTVPGWVLVNDQTSLLANPLKLIVFESQLKGYQDFVEVNYTTILEECRRCGGGAIENDWRYGSDGEVVEIRDSALLLQEIQKTMFTLRGSNPFHPGYGSNLLSVMGSKNASSAFLQNLIISDVQETFSRWQTIKTKQEQVVGQYVSDAEFPFRLQSVTLQQSATDPTVIFLSLVIQNRSNQPINITQGIRLPYNLLDETQAQGLLRQSLSDFTLVK